MNFKKEWNEYVIGYVLTSDDNRNINVQYEVNRNSNHPEPNVVAVIGAEGDETINAYTYEEQEEIKQYILADEKIQAVAKAMTTIIYTLKNINFYEMSNCEILELAGKCND
jgi:hypothetical protein